MSKSVLIAFHHLQLTRSINSEFEWVNTVTQKMINNAADPTEGYISPCVIEEVTVKTEFDESVVNIRAQLLISPYANINLGQSPKHCEQLFLYYVSSDVDVRGDCCSNRDSMVDTRRAIGAAITDHIKRLVERTAEQE